MTSKAVFYTGLAVIMLAGLASLFPLWKSRTLSPASIQRRVYWTGTVAGVGLLFVGVLPDWRSAFFVSGCAAFVMVITAWRFTSHIKISGRVYEFMRDSRRPDPPPALEHTGEPGR